MRGGRACHLFGRAVESFEQGVVTLGDERLVLEPDDDLGVERRMRLTRPRDHRVDRLQPVASVSPGLVPNSNPSVTSRG